MKKQQNIVMSPASQTALLYIIYNSYTDCNKSFYFFVISVAHSRTEKITAVRKRKFSIQKSNNPQIQSLDYMV